MTARTAAVLTLVAVSILQIGTLSAQQTDRVVTLVGDPWPPYILGELGQEATGGIGVELMRAIFERIENTRVSNPMVPWNRALREVKTGTKDGIGILLKTPERETYMVYTDELFRSYATVWYSTRKFPNGIEWQQHLDLKPYTIGVIRGHRHSDELNNLLDDGTLNSVAVTSVHQLFALLDKGRVDLVVADFQVGEAFAQTYTQSGRHVFGSQRPTGIEIYYIAFSKKSSARHLIPDINRAILELREEGVIQRLVGNPMAD